VVTPKRERDARDDPRERATVVPNTHGTTGMDPLRLVRELDEASAAHPLAALGSQARVGLDATLRRLGYRRRGHAELLSLCSSVTCAAPR
jgi:hypothetical protein